jgi:predicted enzyme related to lactoylglutathione lyase
MPRIIHFDLPADDPKRAIRFYEKVFGWKIEKWDGPIDYWLIMTGDEEEPGIDGGLAKREEPDEGIVNTLDVPSVDEFIEKVKKNGGKIVREKHPVPGVGYMATIEDTEGNLFGMMEEDPSAK